MPLVRRLEQVSKVLHRRKYGTIDNSEQTGFGKFGIVLVGDFGQLPPVLATSLIGRGIQESKQSGLRTRALQGQLRFQEFTDVVCLKRIYRQKNRDLYKDSTIRLRDAVCTPDDWKLWKSHDIEGTPSTQNSWPDDFLSHALQLTVENSICGSINGEKLQQVSSVQKQDPKLNVILKCKAVHNDERGRYRAAAAFRNLKDTVHLALLAPVMLTQNTLYGVNTVSLGLMNGARGVFTLAILITTQERHLLFGYVFLLFSCSGGCGCMHFR